MSLFIRLSAVAAIAVLLRCVSASVVITAPSTVTDNTGGLETREQGPTAWICSALAVNSPWTSYANIRGYLEGGNAEKKDYSNLVLYPVMELFHASESRLCVYLPAEDHCFPPAPSTSQVKAVKQLTKRNYYAIRFWGQASDARVQYYKQKLTAALNAQSKAANFDLFFVSYFSDHVREVRYDPGTTAQTKSADPLKIYPKRAFTCPPATGNITSGTTIQVAGQEYLRTTLLESRLNLSDVWTKVVSESNIRSQDDCAREAFRGGQHAFSFVSGVCKVYEFEEHFCPCAPGDFDIYINTKQLGESKGHTSKKPVAEGVKQIVIYTEIPFDHYALRSQAIGSKLDGSPCDEQLGKSASVFFEAFIMNNRCYTSPIHDIGNCNQTCRGQPADVFVKGVPIPTLPFLSMCGQRISARLIEPGGKVFMPPVYVSHAGLGCYFYPEAKTPGEEDCIVTFEKDPTAKTLVLTVPMISLSSEGTTCNDVLSIYDGKTTTEAFRKYNGCSGYTVASSGEYLTVKFHRGQGSTKKNKNFGFKMHSYSVNN